MPLHLLQKKSPAAEIAQRMGKKYRAFNQRNKTHRFMNLAAEAIAPLSA
jgi:hypothetical protein